MSNNSPSEQSGWPRSIEELRENARLMGLDPLEDAKSEIASLYDTPSYIIGSREGDTAFGSLSPELDASLREELQGIFDNQTCTSLDD